MRNKFKQLSFRQQVLLLASALLVALSITVAVTTAWVSHAELKKLLFSQGKEWSQSLAKNSVTAFLYQDAEVVRDSIKTMMDTGKIEHLVLRTFDGDIILDQGIHDDQLAKFPQKHQTITEVNEDSQAWFYSVAVMSDDSIVASSTIQDESGFIDAALIGEQTSQLLGYVHMTLSKESLDTSSRQVFINNLVIALILSAIVILILMAMMRKMFVPLEKLATVMGKTSEGDWQLYVDLEGPAEIKGISRSYNDMISTLKERDEELIRTNINLESTVKLRTKELESFNYTVSHDLRAPLRSIDGFCRILIEDHADKLGEDGNDYLNRVRKSTKRMGELIDNLLSLSRVSRQEIEPQEVDLDQICTEVLELMIAADVRRKVEIKIEPGLKTMADMGLVWIVLENLLGNAWKYSSKREVTYLDIGRLENHNETFYIKDKGAGFDMQYASKLFSPFQRQHRADEFEGSGIGLATVKRIIDKHHGKIWVESAEDVGTTVYFSFVQDDK